MGSMSPSGTALAFILAVFILFAVFMSTTLSKREQTPIGGSQPTPQPTVTTVPTPNVTSKPFVTKPQTYVGDVLSISDETVGYKDSLIVTIESGLAEEQVYVTDKTVVRDSSDQVIDRDQIREGDTLVVDGTVTEGGIEAVEVRVSR
jgi:hypothetical protein